MTKFYKNCHYFVEPEPEPELKLLHRLQLQLKSPAPAGSSSTTLRIIIKKDCQDWIWFRIRMYKCRCISRLYCFLLFQKLLILFFFNKCVICFLILYFIFKYISFRSLLVDVISLLKKMLFLSFSGRNFCFCFSLL